MKVVGNRLIVKKVVLDPVSKGGIVLPVGFTEGGLSLAEIVQLPDNTHKDWTDEMADLRSHSHILINTYSLTSSMSYEVNGVLVYIVNMEDVVAVANADEK